MIFKNFLLILSSLFLVTSKDIFASDSFQPKITWITIPTQKIVPFLDDNSKQEIKTKEYEVQSFQIAQYAATNLDFLQFVKQNPKWEKSHALKIFTDNNFLKHWDTIDFNELQKNPELDSPVVNVSWFAASAYCSSIGARLPTSLEWEIAADTENPENMKIIMNWYSKISTDKIPTISSLKANKFGVIGINGVIWEWVEDFNSVMITTDSRNKPDNKVTGLFCGGGSLNAKDTQNYAAFMRYAFRNSLDGRYTNGLLGFRCVKDLK